MRLTPERPPLVAFLCRYDGWGLVLSLHGALPAVAQAMKTGEPGIGRLPMSAGGVPAATGPLPDGVLLGLTWV